MSCCILTPFLEAGLTATEGRRVPGWSAGIIYVRFGAHSGLKSDIAGGPFRAKTGQDACLVLACLTASDKFPKQTKQMPKRES
jgi:hypothetical protein